MSSSSGASAQQPSRHVWSRLAPLLAEAATAEDGAPLADVARLAAEALGVDEACLAVVEAGVMASATGGAWSVGLTADQVLLGEGPAVAALSTGEPAVVADVAASAAEMPVMAERATAAGAAAAFLFPLGTQAATLGLLAAYRRTPGPLSDDQQADARIIARVATVLLLRARSDPSDVAAAALGPLLEDGAILQDEVHVAVGMVAEALDVSVAEALVRIRAHAFTVGWSLIDVAHGIIRGTIVVER